MFEKNRLTIEEQYNAIQIFSNSFLREFRGEVGKFSRNYHGHVGCKLDPVLHIKLILIVLTCIPLVFLLQLYLHMHKGVDLGHKLLINIETFVIAFIVMYLS